MVLSRTLDKDAIRSSKEALIEIYRKLRPGDPPTLETATNLFRGMFFDPRKYDFSRVGRLKFNIKMGLDTPLDNRTLDTLDFVSAISASSGAGNRLSGSAARGSSISRQVNPIRLPANKCGQ